MSVQPLCFPRRAGALTPSRLAFDESDLPLEGGGESDLGGERGAALATLLPILGCGEEAASLSFAMMAAHRRLPAAASQALAGIAADEQWHDALIGDLIAALPPVAADAELLAATRAMHVSLGRTVITGRLARVAGLDSAVCLILARVLKRLPAASPAAAVLKRIHADEARHVAISGAIAADLAPAGALNDEAAHARGLLASVIAPVGGAFEALGVDADRLRRDLARVPAGLFPS